MTIRDGRKGPGQGDVDGGGRGAAERLEAGYLGDEDGGYYLED